MPDNRQSSKQRRAARNRAARAALAARRENAVAARSRNDDAATFSSAGAGTTDPGGGGTDTSGAGTGPAGGAPARYRGRRSGDTAVVAALGLAIIAAVVTLFAPAIEVDDRGEPMPAEFRGLYIQVREMRIDGDIGEDTASLWDVQGPAALLWVGLPVLVCAFAVWANRRPDRSRLLTFAMLALAGTVVLLGAGFLFIFPLIALAVASFQVRKAEAPARAAERAAVGRAGRAGADGAGPGGRDVIDLDSEEVTPGSERDDDDGSPPGR